MVKPDSVVRTMLSDWYDVNRDATKMAAHFAEDAVYRPMPGLAPVTGRSAIRHFTARILTAFDSVEITVHFQTVEGNIVMNERTDVLRRRDHVVKVPAMGIFKVENGLIAEWRDYSDMGALLDGFNFGSNIPPAKTKGFWSRTRPRDHHIA